jgi:PHS family inorganic phosphate transporter-like MFS transporter
VRGLAHGFSAAVGKFGAILSALLFNYLASSASIGLPNVLWIFFACNITGAVITWFLIPETKGRDADVIDFQEWQQAAAKKAASEKTPDEKTPDQNAVSEKTASGTAANKEGSS